MSPGWAGSQLLTSHLGILFPPTLLDPGLCQSLWSPSLSQSPPAVPADAERVISGVFPRRMPARTLPFPAQPDGICPSVDVSPAF